jgi:CDP-diacylglycerol---glycerol-3-phosphate 3-phosphatidyltransferase
MANLITVLRFPVLLAIVLLFSAASPAVRLLNIGLLVLLILMDSLDGIIARRRNEVSLLGSVLDIMADRAVELILWVCYAHLRLIPVAIPLIVILRGTVVDSLRSVHVSAGQAPFKAMRTPMGKWLVGSPVMRSSYGVVKLVSFAGLALTHALAAYAVQGSVGPGVVQTSLVVFNITSWLAVLLCLVRGVPVVVEALPAFRKPR